MSVNDVAVQFWQELISRPSGPLAYRFLVQPRAAIVPGLRDGRHGAIANRMPRIAERFADQLETRKGRRQVHLQAA
ncbi:MAG TPA: hypothetical protein VKB67_10930 [Rhizomicrobium sp.]|nr:hypothetical protein [Rhizomicrobium sp.]